MKNQRKIDLIVVHCSATRINQDFPVEALEACHKARGFHSIGYHYYITKDGVVYTCRPESEEGAHARHYNAHSIGICYEGGLDEKGKPADTRTPAQKASLEPRLSRCRDPRSSRPSLGSQELSLLRCQGMAEGNRLPSLENAPHLKTDGEFFRISTLQRHHYITSSYTYQFSKNVYWVPHCSIALLKSPRPSLLIK